VRKYRQFVYETGAVDAGKGKTMDKKIVEKARKKGYKISRVDRFRYRCRYFTDSGVIGGPVKSCYAGHFVNFTRRAKDFVQEAPVKWEEILRGKYLTR